MSLEGSREHLLWLIQEHPHEIGNDRRMEEVYQLDELILMRDVNTFDQDVIRDFLHPLTNFEYREFLRENPLDITPGGMAIFIKRIGLNYEMFNFFERTRSDRLLDRICPRCGHSMSLPWEDFQIPTCLNCPYFDGKGAVFCAMDRLLDRLASQDREFSPIVIPMGESLEEEFFNRCHI